MKLFFIILLIPIYSKNIITKPYFSNMHTLPLFWKIGKKKDFCNKPQKYIFNDYPLCIYKNNVNKIIAISDVCIHRGASLSKGKLINNNVMQCPYHGWEYEDGLVKSISGCSNGCSTQLGVPKFETRVTNDDVYIRPTYDIHSESGYIYNHTIYIPPEANDNSFIKISGCRKILLPYQLITENLLDMLHVSYVHSFGNAYSPIPYNINYKDLNEYSGKTSFHYNAGLSSMSKIIGGTNCVLVENEFHLPDATVTRVTAKNITKTIITHCYPISDSQSIFHFDLYRNFLTSPIFNSVFTYQMEKTLKEDLNVLNNIYINYKSEFLTNKYDITQQKYRSKINKILTKINL